MNLLSPSFGVFFWQFITICVVIAVLKKLAFGTIMDTIEKRKKIIDDSLNKAKEVDEKLKDINKIKDSAEKECEMMKVKAGDDVKAMRNKKIEELNVFIEQTRKSKLAMVEKEIAEKKNEFSRDCTKIGVEAAYNFILDVFSDAAQNDEKSKNLISCIVDKNCSKLRE